MKELLLIVIGLIIVGCEPKSKPEVYKVYKSECINGINYYRAGNRIYPEYINGEVSKCN